MACRSKFDLTELPLKSAFYSKLNETDISDTDYASALDAWRSFNCRTFCDNDDHYLTADVLLLADIFKNFQSISLANFGLDPEQYYTLSGLAWDGCLKMTGVKLFLLSNIDMHLFTDNSIQGGSSMISYRYSKANNEYLADEQLDKMQQKSFIPVSYTHLTLPTIYSV